MPEHSDSTGPARTKFVRERLVDRPMDGAEEGYWLGVFFDWEDQLDAGELLDEGRAHWVQTTRRHLWKGYITRHELAGSTRHEYIMDLWDKEHREPHDGREIDWATGTSR